MPPASPQQTPGLSRLGIASLLVANIATIILFIRSDGSIMQVLWTYWLQSVIIGIIAVARILGSQDLDMRFLGVKPLHNIPGRIVNWLAAGFFTMHYGMFHVVYAVFLSVLTFSDQINVNGTMYPLALGGHVAISSILFSGLLFAVHHYITFRSEKRSMNASTEPQITGIFTAAYARILPMHLIIILGPIISIAVGNYAVFIVFMVLKTIADLRLQARRVSHPRPAPSTAYDSPVSSIV